MSTSRVFVGRLAGKGVFDPAGERIGKIRDVIVVERAQNNPRVVGLIVEIPGRRRVFTPIGRITAIANGQVISTGLINVRRFEQRGNETRLMAEILGREVTAKNFDRSARIEDAAIERLKTGEWVVSEVYLRFPSTSGVPFARGTAKLVPWLDTVPDHSAAPHEASAEVFVQTLVDLKAADLAEALLELSPQRRQTVVAELSDHRVADALEQMVEADQLQVLSTIDPERAGDVLDRMEPDDAADLIAALPGKAGEEMLEMMEPEEAEDVRRLLEYGQDTAGGLMNPTPIVLSGETSVAEALARIRRAEVPAAMAAAVYITLPPYETPTGEYQGMVHFQRMLRFPPHERLATLLDDDVDPVSVHSSAAEVARMLASYDMVALPVVDEQRNLAGVVTVDDVLDHLLPDDWRHVDSLETPRVTAPRETPGG